MSIRDKLWVSLVLLCLAAFLAFDIVSDLGNGTSWVHASLESFCLLLSLTGVGVLWIRYRFVRIENKRMQNEIQSVREDLARYKEETQALSQGLNTKIRKQLELWGLSEAETAVCLLTLRGLASKEIAHARGTSEKTVTQQLTNIYQKSKLQGRAELFAFFLEDLFLS